VKSTSCHGDTNGQILTTDFLQRLRPEARFDSRNTLIAQMWIDTAQARVVLAREMAA
jgi:FAD synthase